MSVESYLAECCRWYVLIALLAAAVGKSMRFGSFRSSLDESFPPLAAGGSLLVATSILVGEWSAALLMLAGGVLSRAGLMLAFGLFLFLTAVVALVLAKGLSVRCSCFGASRQRISGVDLIRNLLFITAAGFGLYGASATGITSALGGLDAPATVAIVMVAMMVFLLSIHLREIAGLLRIRGEDL